MQVQFVRAVVCDGVLMSPDTPVDAESLAAGTLDCCLRLGHCVPFDPRRHGLHEEASPSAPPAPATAASAPETKTPKPRRHGLHEEPSPPAPLKRPNRTAPTD